MNKLIWANFLHIYQPYDQMKDILEAVVNQSYRPIIKGLKKNKNARITININGALVELFDKYAYRDIIDDLRKLSLRGQIEFTGSAKYHAFLPLLSEKEIYRQITINDETNKFFLGDGYAPKGFFPPEMGYTKKVARIIEELGFEWIIVDEIAHSGKVDSVDYRKIYQIANTKIKVFFRERRISNLIMSAVVRSSAELIRAMREDFKDNRYAITAMDGETFGHHRPGLENLLFQIFSSPKLKLIQISEIAKNFPTTEVVEPIESTWASSEKDIEQGVQFLSWNDPTNIIHAWQHEFVEWALHKIGTLGKTAKQYAEIIQKKDIALASDHFWWASAKPWWSLEMIEAGAYRLLDLINQTPDVNEEDKARANEYYKKIVSTAFEWQRSGKIRRMAQEQMEFLRVPFQVRTLGKGGEEEGVYFAFLDMMKQLEKKAAKNRVYEQSILWRDAIYKIEHKLDIYEALNAIDLLRVNIPHKTVEKTILKYKEKYKKIKGGQPEQRGS